MSIHLVVFLLAIIVPPIVVAACIGAAFLRQKSKRERELREWARTNGFTYSAKEALMDFRYRPLGCLPKGDYCYFRNVMEGTSGNRPFCAFDYYWHSEYGNDSSKGEGQRSITQLFGKGKGDHRISAVVTDTGIPLLPLSIGPRGLLDGVTEFIGFEEIGFESAEFDQKFRVKSSDRRWAYTVVHQKTMELLLAHPHLLVDFHATQVMAYSHPMNRLLWPDEFQSALKLVTDIVDSLPRDVVEELKAKR